MASQLYDIVEIGLGFQKVLEGLVFELKAFLLFQVWNSPGQTGEDSVNVVITR